MKKKLIALTLIITCLLASIRGFKVNAEEVIKPNLNSTYITEYEDNKQINFTLTSDTKCIVKMYDNGNELAVINCDYTCEGDIYTFSALGGELSKMKFNGTTFEDYEEPIVEEDKTYLEVFEEEWLPRILNALFGMFGTGSLLGILIAIIKKTIANVKASADNLDKKASDYEELAKEKEQTIDKLETASDNINEVIDSLKKIDNLAEVVLLIVENNPQLIESGLAKQAVNILGGKTNGENKD